MADTIGVLELTPAPTPRRRYLADVREHFDVMMVLARKDFQTRYKRASLGVIWAVLVPVIQASVMAFIFSRFVRFDPGGGGSWAPVVMFGIITWTFVASSLSVGATAVVDNSALTEKVWFPRAILCAVPTLANLVGFVISLAIVGVIAGVFMGSPPGWELVLVVPAILLASAFSIALAAVLAALHVYFRDVRYLVQAALMVWMWVTPIIYPQDAVGGIGPWLDLNPVTGIVDFMRLAVLGRDDAWVRPTLVTVGWTVVLAVVALEVHRRHDRLFVDRL